MKQNSLSYIYKIFSVTLFFALSPLLKSNPIPSGSAISIIAPTTINQPGTFRLAQDISGTVTINADQVFFDLNEKAISGGGHGIIVDGQTDITIRNGFVNNTTFEGIQLTNCTNAQITNIDFIGNSTAVSITKTSTGITVKNCKFRNNVNNDETTDTILSVSNSSKVKIANCTFEDNESPHIVLVDNSQDVACEKCTLVNNSAQTGMGSSGSVVTYNICFNAIIDSCIVTDNFAQSQFTGINFIDTQTSCIINNIIKRNISVAYVSIGIGLDPTSYCVVLRDNLVMSNRGGTSSVGMAFATDPFNDIVLGNQVIDHNTNYSITKGSTIPVAILDFAADPNFFELNSTDTLSRYHNISSKEMPLE